ncbi:MAG: 4-hydroxybenzoate octaprenyltransferase [Gammaproteobacteria bacterium]|nr:4-hydroxybenzoate octaprenyltransferase [Gammaproteobacteria bacterium]
MHCHFFTISRCSFPSLSRRKSDTLAAPKDNPSALVWCPVPGRLAAYVQLMRLDRPVGTLLLLWPTLAALWIAAGGTPPWPIVAAFVAGTFLMRAAGCVVNDMADRDFDPHVTRTANRPLATGRVSRKEAGVLFVVLALLALAVVMTLNTLTRLLAVAGLLVAVAYPFMKRYTHLPQLVLGVAFSWGIPMAFAAVNESVSTLGWLLFLASLLWIVAYDTEYAMVDRRDDLRAGVKSIAILFGRADRAMIALLQAATLGMLVVVGVNACLRIPWFAALAVAAGLFLYQQHLIRDREEARCFAAFRNNTWVGFALFVGAVAEYAMPGRAAA